MPMRSAHIARRSGKEKGRSNAFALASAFALAFVLAHVGACSKDDREKGPPAASVAEVLRLWKEAGLEPTVFAKAEEPRLGGAACQQGTIDGIDVLVCEYADEAAARKAEERGLAVVGEATGASLARGKLLLVVADRRNADPNGRRIHQITRAFRLGKP